MATLPLPTFTALTTLTALTTAAVLNDDAQVIAWLR